MLRKCFLVHAVLSLAVVCIAVDAAQAQSRRAARQERREARRDTRRGASPYVEPGVVNTYESPYTYEGPGYSTRSYSYYYTPTAEIREPARANAASANVRMMLPDPKARVWFDGALTTQTGPDRLFSTPTLSSGAHTYTIRASWMEGGREVTHERTINVAAGRTTVVDFLRR
jgi:uncharacterized protein (TIGR03000 family)